MPITFDPTDPLGMRQRQLPALQPLQQQEEDSLLSRIGGKALGGLGWVGDFLDKYTGGRAVRGLLGGKPGELASILPFSDQLGITDEANRVSGRELTDQLGLSQRGSSDWLDAGVGIGADIFTNPSTYLSFGGSALTDAGKAAQKVGILPTTTRARIAGLPSLTAEQAAKAAAVGIPESEIAGQALGGLAKFKIPFTGIEHTFGAGPGGTATLDALNSAGSALHSLPGVGRAYDAVGNMLEPVGRHLSSMFNSKVAGATSVAGQKAGRAYTAGVESGLQGIRGFKGEATRALEGAGALDQGPVLRQVMEQTQGAASPLGQGQALNQVADKTLSMHNALDAEGAAKGFAPHQLVDTEAQYAARHVLQPDVNTRGFGGRQQALPLHQAALDPREEMLKNIPGGTETINRLSTDPEFSGIAGRYGPQGSLPSGYAPTTPLTRAQQIREKYLGVGPAEEQAMGPALQKTSTWNSMSPMDKAANPNLMPTSDEVALASKLEQSTRLENWASTMDPKRATEGVPFFGNHPIDDAVATMTAKVKRNQAGEAVHDLLADTVTTADKAGPGWVRLDDALGKVGFDDLGAAQKYALQKQGGKLGNTSILEMYVPPDALADAQRFMSGFTTPDGLKGPLAFLDAITNMTKAFQTAIWPGFHARNFVSGLWQNFVLGAHDPAHSPLSPMAWAKPVMNAQTLLRGGAVEGASEIPFMKQLAQARGVAMTDAEATAEIGNLAHQYRATSGGTHHLAEVEGAGQAQNMRASIPGMDPFPGFGPTMKQAIPTSWEAADPRNLAGVGANKDVFAPIAAGRQIGANVEDTNRLSAFIGKLQQGFHPEEAAKQVRAAHVDYAALSDFEKQVLRRLIPFYTYSRGTIPHVLENMIQNPGGLSGQLAMATNELRGDKNRFLPEYLGGGLAIPTGSEKDGTQRFLTRIDTPVENTFDKLKPSLSGTLMGLLGETNPLIKAPLEYATGKQFMTGRDLADLYPMTGNTVLDQVVTNSPAGRFYTTGRTLMDERKDLATKALNVGTGVKLSDVDLNKARDVQAREGLADVLRGQQGVGRYETFYARPDQLPNLTPEEVLMLRLQKTLDERAKARGQAARVGVQR